MSFEALHARLNAALGRGRPRVVAQAFKAGGEVALIYEERDSEEEG